MPSTTLRQTVLRSARHVVVKLGTQLLSNSAGPGLDVSYFQRFAAQIAELRAQRYQITVVSSGAIGAGCAELGLTRRPADVAGLQAVAAVGQRRLMTHFYDAFAVHGLKVAQLLLTRSDFDHRVRFLNIRNCIAHLHQLGCLPVINENDTVAVDELRFGDNDMLAALMCNALCAHALILLTVVDGLLDDQGQRIDLVHNVMESASLARKDKSALGTGGMRSKLEAARMVVDAGEIAVIANGRDKDVLLKLLRGEKVGTVFVPGQRRLDSRERWIGLTRRPDGAVTVDDGAAAALRQRGKSLLASGITGATGQFQRGDIVWVRDAQGGMVARGISNYSADEIQQIMGKRSSQFEKILGHKAYAEVIHRDNLVLIGPQTA